MIVILLHVIACLALTGAPPFYRNGAPFNKAKNKAKVTANT